MEIYLGSNPILTSTESSSLHENIENCLGLTKEEYYFICNGKLWSPGTHNAGDRVHIVPRVLGGKGGFGSMLRAIGAQIEKTTNREACRDLSGRRLRDINEEQRLKNWINTQAEREKEAADRKRKKLEKLCERPRHEFKDEEYDKERSSLPELVADAVTQGMSASCSKAQKRKLEDEPVVKKKIPKLWLDDDLDDLSCSDDESESVKSVTESSSSSCEQVVKVDSSEVSCDGKSNDTSGVESYSGESSFSSASASSSASETVNN